MLTRFSAMNMLPSAKRSMLVLFCCVHRAEKKF